MELGFTTVEIAPPLEVRTTWADSGTPDVIWVLCVVIKI
jgi:hypothetical protein